MLVSRKIRPGFDSTRRMKQKLVITRKEHAGCETGAAPLGQGAQEVTVFEVFNWPARTQGLPQTNAAPALYVCVVTLSDLLYCYNP
jgi:hypothetical protein